MQGNHEHEHLHAHEHKHLHSHEHFQERLPATRTQRKHDQSAVLENWWIVVQAVESLRADHDDKKAIY